MIRHSYGPSFWYIPGGAPHRHEQWKDAARREAQEETGVSMEHPEFFFEFVTTKEFKRDTVHCFVGTTKDEITIDNKEIAEAGWFELDDLPKPLSLYARLIIDRWQETKTP